MPRHTLSETLNLQLDNYLAGHKLPYYQLKALNAYRACRTHQLGGHTQYCTNGHVMGVWHNSCKRRGCPRCSALASHQWCVKQEAMLLDTTHHHWIFTIPHDLLPLWQFNRSYMQDRLFNAVSKTIKALSLDKKFLCAQPATSLSLHTWGRNLSLHPHIHCLISHGGLNSNGQWVEPKKKILFPAAIMAVLFRANFLRDLYDGTNLILPPSFSKLDLKRLVRQLYKKDWVVHCNSPYRHGRGVMRYLARYIKSGPFKESQLLAVSGNEVRFHYLSHRSKRNVSQTLSSANFITLISQHIPQRYNQSHRYYGLYHQSNRQRLNYARNTLGQIEIENVEPATWKEYLTTLQKLPACPVCGEILAELEIKET